MQVSFAAKSVVGSSEYVVGPPDGVAACEPLALHSIVYQVPVTSTGSLNVIETFEARATPVAPAVGLLELTDGAASPTTLLRGFGVAAAKSAALLSVSCAPFPARSAASVVPSVGAAPLPSKKFAFP